MRGRAAGQPSITDRSVGKPAPFKPTTSPPESTPGWAKPSCRYVTRRNLESSWEPTTVTKSLPEQSILWVSSNPPKQGVNSGRRLLSPADRLGRHEDRDSGRRHSGGAGGQRLSVRPA